VGTLRKRGEVVRSEYQSRLDDANGRADGWKSAAENDRRQYVAIDAQLAEARREIKVLRGALVIAEPYVATYPRSTKGIDVAADVALETVRSALATRGADA
jgi:hypothetical protein